MKSKFSKHLAKKIAKFGYQIALWTVVCVILGIGGMALYASDGVTVNNGTTSGNITGPDSVCKQVTNSSGVGASEYIPTATASEWQSFYGHPPSGVSIASCPVSCGGVSYGGYCWYMDSFDNGGRSCDTICASHGGCNAAGTVNYAGTGGSSANCQNVLNALGMGGVYYLGDDPSGFAGIGCSYNVDMWWGGDWNERSTNGATTCAAPGEVGWEIWSFRVCACNN